MFTGLVETLGTVRGRRPAGDGIRLDIEALIFDTSITLGESIAINGVCLTVVEHRSDVAAFELAPETLRKTNLGELNVSDAVNLERSLRVGDRLGGHWVQGHVDGVGSLVRREADGDWTRFVFRLPAHLAKYVVAKGSIAVNGVSLTVVDAGDMEFSVALIPHTLAVTNFGSLQAGSAVNLEVDILAKYLERLISKTLPPN
jgi:riboflavin synthase